MTTKVRQNRSMPASPEQPDHQPLWKRLGPGLITGASDDDPTAVGTYSVAGAQFGYGLLWLFPAMLPLMIAVQEMCGRIATITGKGLAAAIKEHYSPWLLWGVVILLFGANVVNVWADLNIMAASAQMLFGLPFWVWLTVITALTAALEVFVPYRSYVRYLKWLALSLLAYIVAALLPGVHHNWPQIARHLFLPHWSQSPEYILTALSLLGGTISPYLFFWQAAEIVEEAVEEGKASAPGRRLQRATQQEIRSMRADTIVGMLTSQTIAFFILLCAAASLHARGLTHINTAQEAARALLPLGKAGYRLFTLTIVASGMLTVPTLAGSAAYMLSEAMGWRYGLYRRFNRARGFYLTLAGVIAVGYALNFVHSISPIKGLLYAAALNGVVAPPLIVLLLWLCNNPTVVKKRCNGLLSNLFGGLTTVLMAIAAALLFWEMARGQAF
ncbi:MAG TPA: divalent metal cation transporter [Chthonomonadaceae bacterium]|nr:divalent metal cation transporter [Chthonomonadaceae bacterium]